MILNIDKKVVETIKLLSVDAVEKAQSGHPGLPLGAATVVYTLWKKFLKISGKNPQWEDRDRFILSAGHGSMLLYSLLHLFGYNISIEDIKNFRQWGSKTPGHPEYNEIPGVETTTGPLGQGIANAVGMAIAESKLAKKFNTKNHKIVDHFTYVLCGDGCIMEGISHEASSLAGHLKLGKLIMFYDSNKITIDGKTDLTMSENVELRYKAYGWQVIKVNDSNNMDEIENAILEAQNNDSQPSLIIVNSIIGDGSPNFAGKSKAHGSPLGEDEIRLMKKEIGWDENKEFYVPDDVCLHMENIILEKNRIMLTWEKKFQDYCDENLDLSKEWFDWHNNKFDYEFDEEFKKSLDITDSSRNVGKKVLNYFAKKNNNLIGGAADLVASTKTFIDDGGNYSDDNILGKNIYFGIREHGMAAVLNGIALHGGFRVFGSTFLTFADYMKPSIRLAALMKLPIIYIFTHDSIAVGEDGPTHQPVEHLTMLRTIPNMTVIRPADGKETLVAWSNAIKINTGPVALILSRQNLKTIDYHDDEHGWGAHIVIKEKKELPDIILIGSGSEVVVLVELAKLLKEDNIDSRVVSMSSMEIFEQQGANYHEMILPKHVKKRVTLEAGATAMWRKYAGDEGLTIGVDHFGASAPGEVLYEKYGITPYSIYNKIKKTLF